MAKIKIVGHASKRTRDGAFGETQASEQFYDF